MNSVYMYTEEIPHKGKTRAWSINSKSSRNCLGIVKWYAPWRRYCFFPEAGTLYSAGCLQDIYFFITEQMISRALTKRQHGEMVNSFARLDKMIKEAATICGWRKNEQRT